MVLSIHEGHDYYSLYLLVSYHQLYPVILYIKRKCVCLKLLNIKKKHL